MLGISLVVVAVGSVLHVFGLELLEGIGFRMVECLACDNSVA